MASFFVKLDSASWERAMALLEGIDRATLDMVPAWEEMAQALRLHEASTWAKAVSKATGSKAPSHASYLARKAAGRPLNGPKWGSVRAAPGAGPLTATGKALAAVITPQTLEMRPLDMYMGVRLRNDAGQFTDDLSHLAPLQKRYGISKKPNPDERNALSQIILRRLEEVRG